jgi:hypothetical protein
MGGILMYQNGDSRMISLIDTLVITYGLLMLFVGMVTLLYVVTILKGNLQLVTTLAVIGCIQYGIQILLINIDRHT